MHVVLEFCRFLRMRKKWWLLPTVIVMLVMGGVLVLTEGSALAPLMYTIF
jgi:hypothetical protein